MVLFPVYRLMNPSPSKWIQLSKWTNSLVSLCIASLSSDASDWGWLGSLELPLRWFSSSKSKWTSSREDGSFRNFKYIGPGMYFRWESSEKHPVIDGLLKTGKGISSRGVLILIVVGNPRTVWEEAIDWAWPLLWVLILLSQAQNVKRWKI